MTGSFTPGPWKWHWRFEDGLANGSVFSEPRRGHAYAVAICPKYQKKPQWEADARLIAAAPDLYEALQAVIAEWREGYGLRCEDQVRAALAKASGDVFCPDENRRETQAAISKAQASGGGHGG